MPTPSLRDANARGGEPLLAAGIPACLLIALD
jgi:hypothetical protein